MHIGCGYRCGGAKFLVQHLGSLSVWDLSPHTAPRPARTAWKVFSSGTQQPSTVNPPAKGDSCQISELPGHSVSRRRQPDENSCRSFNGLRAQAVRWPLRQGRGDSSRAKDVGTPIEEKLKLAKSRPGVVDMESYETTAGATRARRFRLLSCVPFRTLSTSAWRISTALPSLTEILTDGRRSTSSARIPAADCEIGLSQRTGDPAARRGPRNHLGSELRSLRHPSVNAVCPTCKQVPRNAHRDRHGLVCAFFNSLSLLVPPDHGRACDPQELLPKADRLAFLYNWPRGGPLYSTRKPRPCSLAEGARS